MEIPDYLLKIPENYKKKEQPPPPPPNPDKKNKLQKIIKNFQQKEKFVSKI